MSQSSIQKAVLIFDALKTSEQKEFAAYVFGKLIGPLPPAGDYTQQADEGVVVRIDIHDDGVAIGEDDNEGK